MALIKTHIVLAAEAGDDPVLRQAALARIQQAIGISQINQKRFDRYGVLSGMVEEAQLDKLRSLPEISSVEVDQVRRLS